MPLARASGKVGNSPSAIRFSPLSVLPRNAMTESHV
jgi:hypothetical protein